MISSNLEYLVLVFAILEQLTLNIFTSDIENYIKTSSSHYLRQKSYFDTALTETT